MSSELPTPEFAESPPAIRAALAALLDHRDLSDAQMRGVVQEVMAGKCHETEIAAWLIAFRMKGESAAEIAVAASVLREHMVGFETRRDDVLDTCGTGGDGTHTFNISTATALVVAAVGVPVVKHGNRAFSSKSGSADVLSALGIQVEIDAESASRCLETIGLAFCYGPRFHPALRHVGPARRRLGVRTLFNYLGPLANPARASYQLLGASRPEAVELLANALSRLGVKRALVVCGLDGLDEVSLSAATMVREVRGGVVSGWQWNPSDFGLAPCTLEELRADGPVASAAVIRGILEGREGAAARVVFANAAAALVAAERVATPREGVALAAEAVSSGRAQRLLEQLQKFSTKD